MPVMNGYDLTRAIRQHEQASRHSRCTVLGFTANAQPEERLRCKQAGMDDCLFKPISLRLLGQRLAAIEPAAPSARAPNLNIESFYALSGQDNARIRMLLEELLRSNRQDLKTLLELRVDNGLQPFFVIAHRIKGAARIVSADILIKRCDALEQASLATLESRRSAVQQAMEALEVTLINELAKHA